MTLRKFSLFLTALFISSGSSVAYASDADTAAAALAKASAMIKTPLKLDQYTTLTSVSMTEKLTQQFVYEVTPEGKAKIEEAYPHLAEKAKHESCRSFSHVVKYDGKIRYLWKSGDQVLKDLTISKADCAG